MTSATHIPSSKATKNTERSRAQHPLTEPAILVEQVRYAYPGSQGEALRGISLAIAAGEHICVLGGNGSGKSTLAQLINALITPTAGTARVLGIDAAAQPERTLELRRQVAMVFQHPDDQMVTSIVADDVAFGPENLSVPQPQIAQRVDEALRAVDMLDFAQADPADLSGGQRQRVAIAGALAMRPSILVLDEPAAMLDVRGRRAIQSIVRDLKAQGITIVHITHFMDDALCADRVVVMDRGQVALEGTPDEVFAQRGAIVALGLTLPFTLALANELAPAMPSLPVTADAGQLAHAIARHLQESRTSGPGEAKSGKQAKADAIASTSASQTSVLQETKAAGPAIVFDHVSFSYATEHSARKRPGLLARLQHHVSIGRTAPAPRTYTVRDVSFSVPTGSLTALIGHTGAGKSTIVELACALKVPNAGTVLVQGVDSTDLGRRAELRRSIGYVAQLPERQLFAETVFDDIAFGPRNLGLSEDEVTKRVHGALTEVGLDADPELLGRSPFALSGGQQRAISIAGVLAMRTPILVFDEPMAGLDPQGQERMRALIRSLNQTGRTILLVTHAMDDVAELASHVVALEHGSVTATGAPAEVFTQAADHVPGLPDPLSFSHRLAALGAPLAHDPLTLADLVREVRDGCTR